MFQGIALVLVAALAPTPPPQQQDPPPRPAPQAEGDELVVLTKEAEPFAMQRPDGSWHGLSVELWEEVARVAGWRYRYEEVGLEAMLDSIAAGEGDVAVAALTVTPEREQRMDFGHPYHVSGLGIAVHATAGPRWISVLRGAFTWGFLQAVLSLLLLLLAIGVLVWLFERRRNAEEFGGSTAQGLGSGLWWSAVTMTTVGSGDKAPRTVPGRVVGLFWMFASIILISGFTAAIASSLTVAGLESRIQGAEDLFGQRVGTVQGSTSETWLQERRMSSEAFPDARAALTALRERLDAVVYDAPILRYLATGDFSDSVRVLPEPVKRQAYAFALPPGSELREPLDLELLRVVQGEGWSRTLERYFGAGDSGSR